MISKIQLSICIVTYGNNKKFIINALDSIKEYNTIPNSEIIVTDNASSDDTVFVIKQKFPETIIIQNQYNVGYAPGMNQALKRSKGEYILCMSMDAEITPNSIERLLNAIKSIQHCGIAGPRTINIQGRILTTTHHPNVVLSLLGELFPIKRQIRKNPKLRNIISKLLPNSSGLTSNYSTSRSVKMLSGGIILISKEFLSTVGYLDDNLP